MIAALRQSLAALRLIDRAECKDDSVWKAVVDAQVEVERALRDGEKQEPFGYFVTMSPADTGTVFNHSRIMEKQYADACANQWKYDGRGYKIEVKAAYTHPAPSPQVVAAVPEVVREAIEATFEQRPGFLVKVAAAVRYIAAPLPQAVSAAPSGDVERKDAGSVMPRPCSHCNSGKVKSGLTMMEQPCHICAGSGVIWPNAGIIAAITATKDAK